MLNLALPELQWTCSHEPFEQVHLSARIARLSMEVQMPYQKYRRPPILVRFPLKNVDKVTNLYKICRQVYVDAGLVIDM